MTRKNAIDVMIRGLVCLALLVSVAFFPPSAAHSQSGMHSNSASEMPAPSGHDHTTGDMTAKAGHCLLPAATDDGGDPSGQCCSGICLTVVVLENARIHSARPADRHVAGKLRLLLPVDPGGFLRPPKHLI